MHGVAVASPDEDDLHVRAGLFVATAAPPDLLPDRALEPLGAHDLADLGDVVRIGRHDVRDRSARPLGVDVVVHNTAISVDPPDQTRKRQNQDLHLLYPLRRRLCLVTVYLPPLL